MHERNLVVKCEGTAWCETNIYYEPKETNEGDMAYYIPTFSNSGGTRPPTNCAHDRMDDFW